ncbi:(d)CMP kinase [Allobaculum mucilyticum]|uniref:(d)CMP kinase n=1 Tax=Allobaculum mucilyticum TaxID=2834459 RepID=UPI001E325BBD|nr:(d)CMP kinase [Allobaculum mucilyticum]UNT96233.1 (d)CMP kinase [Allobaculum mucilyticum]
MSAFNVALDGPSGSGKSSVADTIAEKYGMEHLDTGAMYRALAWKLDQMKITPESGDALVEALKTIHLDIDHDSVAVNGQDVTRAIREPNVSKLASLYSALPEVREKLVALQQKIASKKGYILDGRDICDVVLPDAEVKIYLDAAPEARAKRRHAQNLEKGIPSDFDEVLQAIIERDRRDTTREVNPLKISKDAEFLDSSNLTFDQTVEAVEQLIRKALSKESA